MNEELRVISQSYCGMTPKDKGCKTWAEMQQKMADELECVVKNYIVQANVSGHLCQCGNPIARTECDDCLDNRIRCKLEN